jgi:hypothetical protein
MKEEKMHPSAKRSMSARYATVLVLLAVMGVAGPASAATINVPGDYATIQEAINAAADGDTILVAPSEYNESLTVDKSVAILSDGSGPALIWSDADDTPVVQITSGGVRLGAAGQGFTIQQRDPGTGSLTSDCTVVTIDGGAVADGLVTIQGNALQGNNADVGLYVSTALVGGQLIVRDNTFEPYSGATNYGFVDALYFHETDFGGDIGNASLNTATVDLRNNTVNGFNLCGVEFGRTIFKSEVNIADSSLTPDATPTGSTYALEFGDYVASRSSVTISNVTIANAYEAAFLYGADSASSFEISACVFTGVRGFGVYVYDVEYGSHVRIDSCTLTGNGSAYSGVHVDQIRYGATLTVADNAVSGFAYTGLHLDDVADEGGYAWVSGNHVADAANSIYFSYPANDRGICMVDGNTLTGFTGSGVHVEGQLETGAVLAIADNSMTGDAAGASYGICLNGPVEIGAVLEVTDNTLTGFTGAGFHFDEVIENALVAIDGNILTGDSAGAGVYVYQYVEYGADVSVTDNTISGCADGIDFDQEIIDGVALAITGNTVSGFSDVGIDVYGLHTGCHLTIADNAVTGDGVGAAGGIAIADVEVGSTATITGNTVSGFTEDGLYVYYVDEASVITVADNSFTGLGPASTYTGIYFEYYLEYGSTLECSGNTIADCFDGIFFGEHWQHGCTATVSGNTVTGTEPTCGYGIYVSDVYQGTDATIDDNIIGGGYCGIHVDNLDYGSTLTINNNGVTQIADGGLGVYCYNANNGSTAEICGNTVNSASGGADAGIHVDYVDYGSGLTIGDNDVSGCESGFHLDSYVHDGSYLAIRHNRIDVNGYGLDLRGFFDNGSLCEIEYNTVTVTTDDAVFFADVHQSDVLIYQNRFIGAPGSKGIDFDLEIDEGSTVDVTDNCFLNVPTGIEVNTILDTATVTARGNDFSTTTTGINNEYGDAAHMIDATGNWWGGSVVAGAVDASAPLTATPDTDGDGVPLCLDLCPDTATGDTVDAEGCSCYQLDPGDDDGDGVGNCDDLCPSDPDKIAPGDCGCGTPDTDRDGDGTADCLDGCPDDPGKIEPGICGCGKTDRDRDRDGTADCEDLCPDDPDKIEPGDCGCGTPDTDRDGDGMPDCFDECPEDPDKIEPGVCGCGSPDRDTDGDQIPDCFDLYPTDPENLAAQAAPDVDTDGDGVPDEYDECPNDPDKIEPGVCGCGTEDVDSDGDQILDCMDNCPDVPNALQEDADGDGFGDECDAGPLACGAGLLGMNYGGMLPLMLVGLGGMKLRARRRAGQRRQELP